MKAALQSLLHNIVDYAGLFPPAELPLDTAIRNFAAYRACADASMLARFVIPAAKLHELADYHDELFAPAPGFRFSILAGGGSSLDDFAGALASATEQVNAFYARHSDTVKVEAFEVRLPAVVHECDSSDFDWLRKKLTDLWQTPAGAVPAFLEVPPGPRWEDATDLIVTPDMRTQFGDGLPPGDTPFGYKLRTGGVTADAFPSVERVAATIALCRDRAVPIKFTAGLHHPLRHDNDSVATKMHGFINVFAAAVLAAHCGKDAFDKNAIADLLACEDGDAFTFTDEAMHYRDWSVPKDAIKMIRRRFAISFGSCSFDEPREDLQALSWM